MLSKESGLSRECVGVKSLYFHSRPMRHANIPEAYTNTLQWIYDSALAHWLREKDGMFWVSGKPGSGKSTLMKFMAHHHTTRSRLQAWADSQPLVIASHYIWSAGTSMQKSQQGLLQSLHFDIFRSCPECIPVYKALSSTWDQSSPEPLIAPALFPFLSPSDPLCALGC